MTGSSRQEPVNRDSRPMAAPEPEAAGRGCPLSSRPIGRTPIQGEGVSASGAVRSSANVGCRASLRACVHQLAGRTVGAGPKTASGAKCRMRRMRLMDRAVGGSSE
jgi:hypothetical protein